MSGWIGNARDGAAVEIRVDENGKEEINERVLEDGAKELTFKEDGFRYRDRYYGFNPFVGQEIVWKDNKIVWSMNYYGKIISEIVPPKEIYNFLKKALRQVGIPAESVLPTRDGELITEDERLRPGDVIKLVAVISGG